jgi:acyl-CoA synthetase (AMP-forming)/AMP-acid ligase II
VPDFRQVLAAAAANAHTPALLCKKSVLTYPDLARGMDAVREAAGPLANMRVLVVLPDSLAAYLVHLCLFVDRGTTIPHSVRAPSSQLASVLERAQPHLVVTNDALFGRHAEVLRHVACLLVDPQQPLLPDQLKYRLVGPAPRRPRSTVEAAAEGGVRVITFTSGSTGVPKGVCLSERSLLSATQMMVDFLALGPGRRTLVTLPLYDYYGFIQIYAHILAGCSYVLGEGPSFPLQLLDQLGATEATDLALVPHTLRQLLKLVQTTRREAFAGLRVITSSSDVLTEDLLRETFATNPAVSVFNIYGLTEAGRACYRRITAEQTYSRSIGRPSRGVTIEAPGTAAAPGEIVIRGPNLMAGYLRAIETDELQLDVRGEICTGDLGYYDERGELVLVGRKDHMINVTGNKIHPSEIESLALQVPGVLEAQAWAQPVPPDGASVHLSVVPGSPAPSLDDLRSHLRTHLAAYFVPGDIQFVDSITRTDLGGKILRR